MSAIDVIRKYDVYRAPELVDANTRVPASTRILDLITEIEKEDKVLGQQLTAALFEFKRWVELRHEGTEGRLLT